MGGRERFNYVWMSEGGGEPFAIFSIAGEWIFFEMTQ